jgi:hypothetical protein
MNALSLIGPFKRKWDEFTGWWGSTVNPAMGALGSAAANAMDTGLGAVADVFHSIADSGLR